MRYEHRRLKVLPGQRFMLGKKSELIYCNDEGEIRRDRDDEPISKDLKRALLENPDLVNRDIKIEEVAG